MASLEQDVLASGAGKDTRIAKIELHQTSSLHT